MGHRQLSRQAIPHRPSRLLLYLLQVRLIRLPARCLTGFRASHRQRCPRCLLFRLQPERTQSPRNIEQCFRRPAPFIRASMIVVLIIDLASSARPAFPLSRPPRFCSVDSAPTAPFAKRPLIPPFAPAVALRTLPATFANTFPVAAAAF